MSLKQVILVRQDLKLPKGKLAAQVAHASTECVLKSYKDDISKWRQEGMKKVVLKVGSEKDLFKYKQIAEQICPDPKDIVYFALSIYLKAPLWTNEKKLREQNEIKIYATHELIRLLGI